MNSKPMILLFVLIFISLSSWADSESDSLKIKTRVFLDVENIGPFYQKNSDENTQDKTLVSLSSLKTTLKYNPTEQLRTEFEVELTKEEKNNHDTEVEIKDATLEWHAKRSLNLRIGRFKEPMGHESLMGSGSLPAITRSMVTSIFAPGRNVGAQASIILDNLGFYSGLFEIEDDDIDNGMASTSRITFSKYQKNPFNLDLVHMGAAYSYRDLNDSLFQIKDRAEISNGDNIVRSPRFYAKEQHIGQIELGTRFSNMWLMTEYYQSRVNQIDDQPWLYQGFYIQLSGLGQIGSDRANLSYVYKNGEFKQPKHRTHDIEWVIRYSGVSVRDNNLGSEASSLMLGLNYFIKKKSSLMFNIFMPNISGNVVNTNQTGNGLSLRLRHTF